MKNYLLIILLALLSNIAYSDSEVPIEVPIEDPIVFVEDFYLVPSKNLVKRQGVTYEVNSQTPFTGTLVSHHDNGQLKEKVNFKDGIPNGLAETYYENGQLKVKGNYKDGIPL